MKVNPVIANRAARMCECVELNLNTILYDIVKLITHALCILLKITMDV